MRSLVFLLGLVNLVVSGPLAFEQVSISQQHYHPGFTLDLNERRLVQFEGQEPKWLTELEKV
jgi:leucyl aminopeptidase